MVRLWQPSLRASVTLTFAVGALALSSLLAGGTYLLSRHLLVDQREQVALRQTFADAVVVRDGLRTAGADVSVVLASISPPPGTTLFLHQSGSWYSSSLDVDVEAVEVVLDPVEGGQAAFGWTRRTDPAAVVVGTPIRAVDATYYEVAVASDLDRTLDVLRATLALSALLVTLAGAGLGRYVSRRLLKPLDDVTAAAASIAAGAIGTRLKAVTDADLATLVGAFNSMVDVLEERIRRDVRFAADVSHELRTPLTTLITSVELLHRAPDLSTTSRKAVDLMTAELDRFRRSLEDLLALGRLDAGVHDEDLVCVDLRRLVGHALESSGRDRSLLDIPPDERPMVMVDERQVLRALTNLLDNADVHGGGLRTVRIVTRPAFVDVHVVDHGPGVPEADQERVFERFARVGSRRSHPGTGLGLSLVAETMRHHGGAAWCFSHAGRGAIFAVRFPLHEEREPR
jgi:signal transduction histidine kinase